MRQEFSSKPKFELSKNLKIGVLCGGDSSERKISLRSGRAVSQALKKSGFRTRSIDPRNTERLNESLRQIDLAFVALHGHGGEDGKIQTLLESRRIPYIGSDARASRLAFDKALAKEIFLRKNIPTPPSVLITSANWQKKLSELQGPYFFKPLTEGSSIGVFAAGDAAEGAEKIKKALKIYGKLLVERKISGREFTVGVLGKSALPVVELKPKNKFYDYKAKYTKGMTEYYVPADIPAGLAKKMQRIALRVHEALGLRDFSRVDMMTDEKGNPFVFEANSIPGFTELSLLPKAAKADGISFEELCQRLVFAAFQRKAGLKRGNHGQKKKK